MENKNDFGIEKDNSQNTENINIDDYAPNDEAIEEAEADTVVFAMKERERKKELKKKNGRMTKGQKVLIGVIAGIYAILIVVGAFMIHLNNYKPSTDGEVPFDTTENDNVEDKSNQTAAVGNEYSEVGENYNILLVGHDKLAHLADVTMIINVNSKHKTVSVMQIPRDTYVSCEYVTGKINAMFSSYYNSALYSGAEDPYTVALDEYAKLLEKNLCINIHHTAIVNLEGFRKIVDALGGVDVNIPADMYYSDPAQGLLIDLKAGPQHLDGEKAEGFVRFRYGYLQADIGRGNAQKIFMTALFSKLKSTVKSVDVATLNNLAAEIMDNVHTDMTAADILYYAKLALKIDLENITMMTVPGTTAGNYYVINREATRESINKYFNVYNKEISDKLFDRNRLFCADASYISNVYYGDPAYILDNTYTADSISDNSIDIPRAY